MVSGQQSEGPAAAAARLTGFETVSHGPSGTLSEIVLTDGNQRYETVVKRGHTPGATRAEAAGLRWLAEADAVRIPRVHGADDTWLVLDRVAEATPSHAEEFGRDLARLHAAGAPAFGAPPPGGLPDAWIGTAPMRNTPSDSWPEWYAEHRILPYVRMASDLLDPAVFERACARIPSIAGPPEPPARLHGDLWSGNVLWDSGGAVLIDPAAHGGHRETDLAMLHLFGCPQLERIVAAYDEVAPLADGYRERIALHQLFPLLVHTVLFGRSYAGQATAAARSLG
ncbi:fructosamine kinase family protein [Amycolatopsis sp. DR6-1]|uniref:Fructosamine kinase family protein n=1 Tax=Amycolatopsis dendrobii TaxID=2760662 RepID=A0A7W3W1V1_9PSEU|nr:fructosamine kinase family protein [Amycolatopsis dendrobii]